MEDVVVKIHDYSLEEIMGERFGRYSKYIIQDRAIPDIRDGLKPVQRRILYSMFKQRNTHEAPYRKSARVVGEVMGKYHPHGDTSIYEAMVRMSQSWKTKDLLIDMHGNNGSIDGDAPAAMRYTEARLSKISNELLKDIEKDTVIFAPNYDDQLLEPTVLPAKFPNILVNGSSGISAGYATNIPPHNLGEVIEATIKRIDYPNCHLDSLMKLIKGPDFPTGGIVEGLDGIKAAYQTGKGKIMIKANIKQEKHLQKKLLVIDQLPYEVNKASLIKKIDEIRIEKKIDGINDVRDESDRKGLRIVIELKKESNEELIINYLLKNTDLFISYNFNMVSIVNRRPKLLGLQAILDAYIDHQKEVLIKRSKFDLNHALHQLHIVEGYIKAISILDEIIKLIRASKNRQAAEENLVSEFQFTKVQAKAIVSLKLYNLTNTDVILLEKRLQNLNIIIKGLTATLNDERLLKAVIKNELKKIKKEYALKRLTVINEELTKIQLTDNLIIPKERVVVVVTKDGYLKRVNYRSYKASCQEETMLKELDYVISLYEMNTQDTLLLFTNLGNYLYLPVYEIPEYKWKELGKHISNLILIKESEQLIASVPVSNFDEDFYITTFTKLGMIKRTKISDYKALRYSKAIKAINLKAKDEVVTVSYSSKKEVLIVTHKGYGLWFDLDQITPTNLRTQGVKAINLKDDYLIGGYLFEQVDNYLILITNKGNGKRLRLTDLEKKTRNRKGILLIRKVKSNPHYLIKAFISSSKGQLGLKLINQLRYLKISDLPIMDRLSSGSSLIKGLIKDAFLVKQIVSKSKLDLNNQLPAEEITKQISLNDIDQTLEKINIKLDNIK